MKLQDTFRILLGWGTWSCQSLCIRWNVLWTKPWDAAWSNVRSFSLRSIPLRPNFSHADDIQDLTGAICSPALSLTCQLQQLQFEGAGDFQSPPKSWESLQCSPRPGISDPSETMAKLLHASCLLITPLIAKTKCFL